MTRIWAEYVDTCLPEYLTDGHTRDGETLLLCTPSGQSVCDAAEELLGSIDCDCGIPGSITDDEILSELLSALCDVDLRPIDPDGNRGAEYDNVDCDVHVYVVLRWAE